MPDDGLKAQYEALPYPARDPADEAKRLVSGSPSDLAELNHYVFGGRRDLSKPLNVLVAGGGTGDAAIMLAQQMRARGVPGEVLHLDLSRPSQAIARARAEARGLTNLRFRTGSLLEIATAGVSDRPDRFDYIDCCGVLHHLPDPAAGLNALKAVLAEDGGIGLMVYGEYGRTGVYQAQEVLRALAPSGEPAPTGGPAPTGENEITARLALARRLLNDLPPTNWLRRNPFVGDHLKGGDAGLFDMLLHARDRAFRIDALVGLVEDAGLRASGVIEPARYAPETYLHDARLRARARDLAPHARWQLAELLAGNMTKHILYAVRAGNPVAPPDLADDGVRPVLRERTGEELAQQVPAGGRFSVTRNGTKITCTVPPLARAILRRIDGVRSLRDIHADLAGARPDLGWEAFLAQFRVLYDALHGINWLLLEAPPKP